MNPELGLTVLFMPPKEISQTPWVGIICHIWTPTCVNLVIFDSNGISQNRTSVSFGPGESQWYFKDTGEPVEESAEPSFY